MELSELRPLLLVSTPAHEVLKVSEVYSLWATAELVYPIPPRTTVRSYRAGEVASWRPASDRMVARYEEAWGLEPEERPSLAERVARAQARSDTDPTWRTDYS
jgi:hypothetical protein